jgi:hypothetical protein
VRHGLWSRNWARAFNCDGRYGLGLLASCVLLLGPALGGSAMTNLLRNDRAAILAGRWWRLLTAQIVHLGLHHAAINILGLAFPAYGFSTRAFCGRPHPVGSPLHSYFTNLRPAGGGVGHGATQERSGAIVSSARPAERP